eukprot:6003969-Amphidinium_carterae.1
MKRPQFRLNVHMELTIVSASPLWQANLLVRILADARVAIVLIGGSFMVGMSLALGILLEVYTAWGCMWRCG